MNKLCIVCNVRPREEKRRYCRDCYLERKRQQAKNRHKEHGRYSYENTCTACHKKYSACRKEQKFCSSCWKLRSDLAAQTKVTTRYIKNTNYCNAGNQQNYYRRIAEALLERKLHTHEVVHHIDGNTSNNSIHNLLVISRSNHVRLHHFLDDQRVIIEKSLNENLENCWNNLRVPMTTTWLETANVKVKKLWEIGQSAAEPL